MKDLIITHPGSAHFDEFFAICLILASFPEKQFIIERREPLPEELSDPEVWVVDIGGHYDPALKNFDHHQDLELGASFVLVGDHLKISELFRQIPWWRYKDRLDRFGPYHAAKELGANEITQAHSPFEDWFLSLFEENPAQVYLLMQRFGRDVIEAARTLNERIKFWASCRQVRIKGRIVLIGLTDDASGMQAYRDGMAEPASVCLRYDSRGAGWTLYRFNDLDTVDFSRLENHPDILFAHKGGFIAKTRERIPLEAALKLVEMGMVGKMKDEG